VPLLLLFITVFDEAFPEGTSAAQQFLPVMKAFGIMSTSFLNLAIGIAVDRDDDTLKRLQGTPLPRSAYFVGKLLFVIVTGATTEWATFTWVILLGAACFALPGIAVSGLAWSGRNAGAVINLPFLLLQFVSGVFIPLQELPGWVPHCCSVHGRWQHWCCV